MGEEAASGSLLTIHCHWVTSDSRLHLELRSHSPSPAWITSKAGSQFDTMCLQEVQEVGRQRVWDAYLALVQALTGAELVELPPGTGYRHCSSAVLLAGALATSAAHCSLRAGAAQPPGAQRASLLCPHRFRLYHVAELVGV